MFNFFRKKNKISNKEIRFLRSIVDKLPVKYNYLRDQVSTDFLIAVKYDKKQDVYNLVLNANLERKFSNKSLPSFFIIQGIKVWNKKNAQYEDIEIDIVQGMLAGFKKKAAYDCYDYDNVKTDMIVEKHFQNLDKEELDAIIKSDLLGIESHLDLNDTFKMELPEGNFYTIKDLGDGNYLAVDTYGKVYGMIHDPYEIDKLFESIADFKAGIVSGLFDIKKYYDRKMSNPS